MRSNPFLGDEIHLPNWPAVRFLCHLCPNSSQTQLLNNPQEELSNSTQKYRYPRAFNGSASNPLTMSSSSEQIPLILLRLLKFPGSGSEKTLPMKKPFMGWYELELSMTVVGLSIICAHCQETHADVCAWSCRCETSSEFSLLNHALSQQHSATPCIEKIFSRAVSQLKDGGKALRLDPIKPLLAGSPVYTQKLLLAHLKARVGSSFLGRNLR